MIHRPKSPQPFPGPIATAITLAAALAVHLQSVLARFASSDFDFDALNVYLPYAKRFLAEGPAFLLTEESIWVPPFGFLWPALVGPTLEAVKAANVFLSCLLLLVVFRTATLWHSRLAGVFAASLFALTPLLKPFFPTAVTEPPFMFLVGLWIWGVSEYLVRGKPGYLPIAGLALGAAVLFRATLFYWLVLLALVFTARRSRPLAFAHLLALALPLAFIVKNIVVFSFPFFTTGAGNALYLGTSPVTGGYDPFYLGLLFDVGAITREHPHLSLEGERLLGGVAKTLIESLDPSFIAAIYAKKLAAFLFVTNAETVDDVLWLRSWRIALLILSAFGVAGIRHAGLRWLVAGTLLFQVAIHIPVLYTHRYSVGALDVWLVSLAGVGLAWLLARRRALETAAVAAVILIAIMAGGYFRWHGGLPEPDAFRAAHIVAWERRGDAIRPALLQGIVSEGPTYRFTQRNAAIEIDIPESRGFSPYFGYVLAMDSSLARGAPDEACNQLRILFRRADEADYRPSKALVRPIRADGQRHENQFGATSPLGLTGEGRLRLEFPCAAGSRLELASLAVIAPLVAIEYRERYLYRLNR